MSREGTPRSDEPSRVRELESKLAALSARLAERERAHDHLERLQEISCMLVRLDGLDDVARMLESMAAGTPPLRRAVLVTSERGAGEPSCWTCHGADPSGQEAAIAHASEVLAYFEGSSPLPGPREERFVVLPLAGARVGIVGTLLLEWSDPPGEPQLAMAGRLAGEVSATLDRRMRDDGRGLQRSGRAAVLPEELLARVSHELRNLLSVIELDLAQLLRAPELQDLQRPRRQLLRLKRSADRMDHLTRDLLDTASLDAESLTVNPRPLEVASVMREALEAASLLAVAKSIHLSLELREDLPPIFADPSRVQQVFTNLLCNAIKFSPEGATITIGATPVRQLILFSVEDHGPGIPEEDRPKLFQRFSQAKNTTGGSGLGLFIVKGIVKAHGGDVWVSSQVGAGSTFFFTLPVA